MATTKITNPDLFDLGSLNTALKLPSGTTAERPTSPSTGEWRYNTDNNLIEFYDGGDWRDLQSENIPPIPSENFNVVTFTGDNTASKFIEVGFTPDFVWIKPMDVVSSHALYDSTRGDNNRLSSNSTGAQSTVPNEIVTNGFNIIGGTGYNDSSLGNMVAWCWKANGGTTSSNTDGTITSTVQANTKAAFSVVTWTGTGAQGTIGHGLSAAPEVILSKRLDGSQNWTVYQKDLGLSHTTYPNWLYLNLDSSEQNSVSSANHPYYQAPSSTLIYQNTGTSENSNVAGAQYVSYCFASVASYSSTGSYTGNGSEQLIETGFEPAFVITKSTSTTGHWRIYDNKRGSTDSSSSYDGNRKVLYGDLNIAEGNGINEIRFLSNGFEVGPGNNTNTNGVSFIYMAFAADPSAAPVLADSFNVATFTPTTSSNPLPVTGFGFQPSFVWAKYRGGAQSHYLVDSVRGLSSLIYSDRSDAAYTASSYVQSFDSDGITYVNNLFNRTGADSVVAWAWKANSIPTINTDGTIQSVVSANQAAGFSIVRATIPANNTTGSFGHGLSAAPELIIQKGLDTADVWLIYNKDVGTNKYLQFTTAAEASFTGIFANVGASTITTLYSTTTTVDTIHYCFHSVSGFSKIGSYTGNGSTQSITGLGFQPAYVLIKETSAAESWRVFDSARGATKRLFPDTTSAESTASDSLTAFDSDGFSLGSSAGVNENTQTYIYMAFKENPVQYAIPSGQMGYLTVAGGGSGANSGAGGGAGGLRTTYGTTSGGGASAETNLTLAAGTYTITVGAGGVSRGGGSSAPAYGGQGLSGSASTITGVASVSTVGGGGGGSNSQDASPPISASGLDGGSGGGQGPSDASGETPGSGTANEGFGGGTSFLAGPYSSGGGGGAGSAGGNRVGGLPGNGGDGLTISITGSNSGYAGGGGGSGGTSATNFGLGTSGGGNGAPSAGTGISGTANTGGGGGGGGDTRAAGSGGSGIVVLRLNTSDYSGTTTGSPTVTTSGSETILTYTGSGTYVHS